MAGAGKTSMHYPFQFHERRGCAQGCKTGCGCGSPACVALSGRAYVGGAFWIRQAPLLSAFAKPFSGRRHDWRWLRSYAENWFDTFGESVQPVLGNVGHTDAQSEGLRRRLTSGGGSESKGSDSLLYGEQRLSPVSGKADRFNR